MRADKGQCPTTQWISSVYKSANEYTSEYLPTQWISSEIKLRSHCGRRGFIPLVGGYYIIWNRGEIGEIGER
jgi:hypothetical protein